MTQERPASIPEGLVVELSRGKVLPGASAEADRDHLAQAKRTKEPGWVEAEPQVLMLPDPVRQAVLDWALRPAAQP
jgi:hypothetical protein